MADTNFIDKQTVIQADWLNDVNDNIYGPTASVGLRADLANATDPSKGAKMVMTIQNGTGAVGRTVQSKLRDAFNVLDFGAVGDGITDDTTAIGNAIAAAMGGALEFDRNKTYLCTSYIDILCPADINLNGSTINFVLASTTAGFRAKSNRIKIRNGTINLTGPDFTGSGGDAGAPITIGSQSTGVGYSDFAFEDLTLSTNRVDGGGAYISIFGECHNGLVRNIHVSDTALAVNNIVGIEWGGTASGTGHPHDIEVDGIYAGALTNHQRYLVWVSSAFNISVSNLYADACNGLVSTQAGDNADLYAPARYKRFVGRNIALDKLTCNSVKGIGVEVVGKGSASAVPLKMNTTITDLAIKSSNGLTPGVSFSYCTNAGLYDFDIDGFSVGFATGSDVIRPTVKHGTFRNNVGRGLGFGNVGGACISPSCEDVAFVGNNTAALTITDNAAIYLSDTTNPVVKDCRFGEFGVVETQRFSIACAPGNTRCKNPMLRGNHTYSLLSGGIAYAVGNSTDFGINARGGNNSAEVGITLASGCPIHQLDSAGIRTFTASATPTAGSWNRGDTRHNSAPSASGTKGEVVTTSGTSGTLNGGATTADTTNGSAVVVVSSTTGLATGDYITVAGAGLTGVRVLDIIGLNVTVSANATATLTGAAVSFSAPVWKTFGAIAA